MLEEEIEKRLKNSQWDRKIAKATETKIQQRKRKKQVLGAAAILLLATTSYISSPKLQKQTADMLGISSDYMIANSFLNEIGVTTEYEDWVLQSSFLP